jgi:6-phosphogluconolactonase/glucosamine-6-phosphate isomerase/deaminase
VFTTGGLFSAEQNVDIMLTDEYFDEKLHMQRVKMSMRRNILRRTLSEDLYWADCQKNEP